MKVVVMCGVSGSGKSTYVRKHFPGARIFAVDDYLEYGKENVYQDKPTLREAYYKCLNRFLYELREEMFDVIVVDNANTTITGISPFISAAIAFDHEVEIIMIDCDPMKAWRRNQHNVKLEDVLEQYERLSLLEERWSSWWPSIKVVKEGK